jgi:N4-gp56 family major capsid protein
MDGLADWWAKRYDQSYFGQVCGDDYTSLGTNADYLYSGMNAPIDPVGTSDTTSVYYVQAQTSEGNTYTNQKILTLADIGGAVTKFKTRATDPGRPVMLNGKQVFVMFLEPNVADDLRENTATGQWLDIQKAAMQGGLVTGNPIFSDALGMYKNVVLHESSYIREGEATNTTGKVYRNVLVGAQSACIAYGRGFGGNPFEWEEELFVYKNKLGVSAGCNFGIKKLVFNSIAHGAMIVPSWTAD